MPLNHRYNGKRGIEPSFVPLSMKNIYGFVQVNSTVEFHNDHLLRARLQCRIHGLGNNVKFVGPMDTILDIVRYCRSILLFQKWYILNSMGFILILLVDIENLSLHTNELNLFSGYKKRDMGMEL